MNEKKRKQPLTPEEIRKKAKQIVKESPMYIKDEPPVVGSPDSLTEELESEDESANDEDK